MFNPMPDEMPLKKAIHPQVAFYGLEATICYLMTRFMTRPCPHIARAIVHHLQLLAEHPEAQDEAESNEVYGGLLEEWQAITSALSRQSDFFTPEIDFRRPDGGR
ncbi:hypothetical protein [Nitrosococcus oceani]|uniref:Uncharacterized protein n=2 Tax=Nitrosococcus oceani TaxID=1229 RepID=Q3J8F1_NITOC|nr:hypothetical protein [Nitrosococcus oceani]ABA58895.1 hypothetical protein Noc_2441 [Nitrosococcus oceani ATCC 19707]KFI18695.1 hypothetical protein IB75_12995 [Nitrosococcus oceani C-27]KFI21956.1 hypothetical protein HW44_12510 [Nitrosococcus oceani]GEM19010.1 hypothetical protein NONS58_03760 [Nitrosococcus oceani]